MSENYNTRSIITALMQMKGFYIGEASRTLSRKASVRFFSAASGLEKGQILGMSLKTDENGRCKAYIYISSDTGASCDDLKWIVESCAGISCEESEMGHEQITPDIGREALRLHAEICRNGKCFDEEAAPADGRMTVDKKDMVDLAEMIIGLRGSIDITLAGEDRERSLAGSVIIHVPENMPLRLRCMLEAVFGCTGKSGISGREMAGFMQGILQVLMQLEHEKPYEPDSFDDPDSMPIDTLELSLRTHNALKRARVETVGKLRRMTDHDLMQIRNIGRKNIAEIRNVLSGLELTAGINGCETAQDDTALDMLSETAMDMATEMAAIMEPGPDKHMEMLDELIGLDDVKMQVRRIAAFARLQKDIASRNIEHIPVVLNMEFSGNPGTAKTTVARILAGILHEIGLLESPEVVEAGRAEIVARYVGQTAGQVAGLFEKARGKLLFIDEAYSLVDSEENSFGDEAITAIVQQMENHRKDTIVILAGYPDKMDELFRRNPGLRSRVPFSIRFADYTAEEMAEIVRLEASRRGFSIEASAMTEVLDLCRKAASGPEKGNGRFCRNLAENAILEYAFRLYGEETDCREKEPGEGELNEFVLTAEDFGKKSFSTCIIPDLRSAAPERHAVGFLSGQIAS